MIGVAQASNKRRKPAAAMAANRGEFKLFDSVTTTSKQEVTEPMDVADQESTADAKEESSDDLDEVKKPPIDLFKSIFLDSSSDEEDDADSSEPPKGPSINDVMC